MSIFFYWKQIRQVCLLGLSRMQATVYNVVYNMDLAAQYHCPIDCMQLKCPNFLGWEGFNRRREVAHIRGNEQYALVLIWS